MAKGKRGASKMKTGLDMIRGTPSSYGAARKVAHRSKREMTPAIAEAILAVANVEGALQLLLQRGKQNGRADRVAKEARDALGLDSSGAGPACPEEQIILA